MLMMVDVGNTNTVFGVSNLTGEPTDVVGAWRVSSNRERMADEWYSLLAPLLDASSVYRTALHAVIISSVVPAITVALTELARRYLNVEPLIVNSTLDLGITLKADIPAEVGADRLVNSAYAYAAFGGPTIVVDLGTATKIEAIAANGDYLGGVIAPGLGLSLDSLANRAARLYAVELRVPEHAIGRNTVSAVQSGVVTGHVAMIEGMVERVRRELGGAGHVVLTGGYSAAIVGGIPIVTDYIPDLTLRGLRFLYNRNSR